MTTILPISSSCHSVQLPPTEKDDRLNLNVRTGSASTLYNSLIFTLGGLTIGLDLYKLSIPEILDTFNSKLNNAKSKNLWKYLSSELFYLNLIDKVWARVIVENPTPTTKPRPRLFHEVLTLNNCLYVFGGLVINKKYNLSEDSTVTTIPPDLLVPVNDLWQFNLETKTWHLLYDPELTKHKHQDKFVPTPRFCHKMTHIDCLAFANKPDHYGIFIAGGKDGDSQLLYDNVIFDLVDRKFINHKFGLNINNSRKDGDYFANTNDNYDVNVDYFNSIIVKLNTHFNHFDNPHSHPDKAKKSKKSDKEDPVFQDEFSNTQSDESLVVYSPVKDSSRIANPLLSFKLGKSIKSGKMLPVHRKLNDPGSSINQIIPYNLRYPTCGLFGQNLIITGFLPNDYDISIFVYNRPTGKWSRLNVFCNHDYGSHRFWGGYAWQSHHKVVLIGNYVTSRTTSSIRYFSCLITVNLPVTNILASSELAGGGHYHDADGNRIYFDQNNRSETDDSTTDSSVNLSSSETDMDESDKAENPDEERDDEDPKSRAKSDTTLSQMNRPLTPPMEDRRPSYASKGSRSSVSTTKSPRAISFSEYVHYAAPTTNFTTIRSIFPPAAITLGRNFLDRFGDLISDFEIISVNGDRIPVSLMVLIERWGHYFVELLSNGYVNAVQKFDQVQRLNSADDSFPKSSFNSSISNKHWSSLKSSFTSSMGSSLSSANSNERGHGSHEDNSSSYNSSNKDPDDPKVDRSYHLSMLVNQRKTQKDAPHFRLPFQDSSSTSSFDKSIDQSLSLPQDKTIDPYAHFSQPPVAGTPMQPSTSLNSTARKDSISSFSSGNSLLNSHLQDIPPQLPLPSEPIPAVPSNPSSFKSSSRRNSNDVASPRGSLLHTLTALRNIPLSKSPRGSPFASPRASVSQQGGNVPSQESNASSPLVGMGISTPDMANSPIPNLKPSRSASGTPESMKNKRPEMTSTEKPESSRSSGQSTEKVKGLPSNLTLQGPESKSSQESGETDPEQQPESSKFDPFDNVLLNFENLENGTFKMESSLIPRKLYIPFATTSVKAFCEYLYTGQIGNKWLLSPTTLDNLALAKHYKVPLLYDLISEVLYGIIGKRESWVIKRATELKMAYFKLLKETSTSHDPDFEFPLDEYEGFMDTVDDGYLDIALLKKSLRSNRASAHSEYKKRDSYSRKSSRRSSAVNDQTPEVEDTQADGENEENDVSQQNQSSDTSDEKDSSFDNLETSTSENDTLDDMGLGYLDTQHDLPSMGPRSKSIFDRGDMGGRTSMDELEVDDKLREENSRREKDLGLTLEQLVSPASPAPSLHIIDLIHESVIFVADLKLILRTSNAKQMSRLLDTFEEDMAHKMEEIKEKYEERQQIFKARETRNASSNSIQQQRLPLLHRGSSYDGDSIKLRPIGSSSSLTTVNSRHTFSSLGQGNEEAKGDNASTNANTDDGSVISGSQTPTSNVGNASSSSIGHPPLERARTNSSIRTGISGLTPFKPVKTDPKLNRNETNREVDKRITKLIKKDEKLKQRAEKEEKLRLQHHLRHRKTTQSDLTDTTNSGPTNPGDLSRIPSKTLQDGSSFDDVTSIGSKKKGKHSPHHGLFHHIGIGHKAKEKDKDSDSGNESKLTRSNSPTNSVQSKHSGTSDSKKKHGLFGLRK